MNKVISIILAAVVGIIVIGGVLSPIVSNVTATSDTYVNDGYFELKKYTSEDTLTATWNYSNPTELIVNGESVTIPSIDPGRSEYSIILSASGAARIQATMQSVTFYGAGTYVTANATNPTLTCTYEGGTLTATNGVTTKPLSNVPEVVCIANNGNYVMKKATDSVYVKGDSEIFANGITYFGSQVLQFSIWGTFDNLEYTEVSGNYSVSDFTKVYTESRNHVGLYDLEKFTFIGSYNDTSKTITYDTFVVSKEVTVDRTEPLNRSAANLINILPLFAIIAVLMAVATFLRNRY